MEPEQPKPSAPPSPLGASPLPSLGSVPLPSLAGSPTLSPSDAMKPRGGGFSLGRVLATTFLICLALATIGPMILIWNIGAVSPGGEAFSGAATEKYGADVVAKRKMVKDDMVTALSRLSNDWLLYGHSPDERGFCSRVPGIVESQIEERLEGEDAGTYAAMGVTLDSYPTEHISCDESPRSFVATSLLTLEDGTRAAYCVSSAGGSGLGKVPTFDSGCGETYETPTALPGTPEYEFRLSVGGGAASFVAPTPAPAANVEPIAAVNFPVQLLGVDALGFEYMPPSGLLDGFCESDLFESRIAAPLREGEYVVACVDAPHKFAISATDEALGFTACADWTGYARYARGFTADASCDFIDPPEVGEARP